MNNLTKIPVELVNYLQSIEKLRSQKIQLEYEKVTKIQRDLFLAKVRLAMDSGNPYLVKNQYPYDNFCKNKLDHWLLFVSPSFLSRSDWETQIEKDYPDFDFFFVNETKNQSIKEIPHIHLFQNL